MVSHKNCKNISPQTDPFSVSVPVLREKTCSVSNCVWVDVIGLSLRPSGPQHFRPVSIQLVRARLKLANRSSGRCHPQLSLFHSPLTCLLSPAVPLRSGGICICISIHRSVFSQVRALHPTPVLPLHFFLVILGGSRTGTAGRALMFLMCRRRVEEA